MRKNRISEQILQVNPASPGLQFHKLDKVKDKRFHSVRVNKDIRIIVHRSDESLLLCYVDHHEEAYRWAARRKLETHPKTGAAQLVEIREKVQEVVVPVFVEKERPAPPKLLLFDGVTDEELLGYGVPTEWLGDVRQATEDTLLELADHLPGEAAEALLELATGRKPIAAKPIPAPVNPFDHPDAQRRFRVVANTEELQRALEFPWDKWMVFLHPEQRQWVERDYNGPARVSGSAGTGKTIVALHRAAHLARNHPDARVLLTTFSDTLANALHHKLRRLISHEPHLADRLEVHSINAIGLRLYQLTGGKAKIAAAKEMAEIVKQAAGKVADHKFSQPFLLSEWNDVVDAWQLDTWESYRDVARLGRKTRLPEKQRTILWAIFEIVKRELHERNLITLAEMFKLAAANIAVRKKPPFDFAVVDESQDIGICHLRFLAAMGADRPNALFFAGDLGQRIFQPPFSWLAMGVDVRGRSRTLRVNYRTSHQIRMQADRLLDPEIADIDGIAEDRSRTVSVFNGPTPLINVLDSQSAEIEFVAGWIAERVKDGVAPHEVGVIVRSKNELERAESAAKMAGLKYKILVDRIETTSGYATILTMPLAKGLEFRAVAVMACDDEVVPLQIRINSVGDESDLKEVYDTERHLLYVACTRARDFLIVTGIEPPSEFLDDLRL